MQERTWTMRLGRPYGMHGGRTGLLILAASIGVVLLSTWARMHACLVMTLPNQGPPISRMSDSSFRLPLLTASESQACMQPVRNKLDVWITGNLDWKEYVMPQFGYTIASLTHNHGFVRMDFQKLQTAHSMWAKSNGARSVTGMLADLSPSGRPPGAVLVWEARHAHILKWLRQAIPVFFFIDDIHYVMEWQRGALHGTLENIDMLFNTYAYNFARFHPNFTSLPVKWIPHAASPDFYFHGISHNSSNTALLSGAVDDRYPSRILVRNHANIDPRIVILGHPGYNTQLVPQNHTYGRRYAETVREHRAAVTCGSMYNYVVAKFFEIPATGALLIAHRSMLPHLAELGLFDGMHLLSYDEATTLRSALEFALANDTETAQRIDRMRAMAQQVIMRRHTTAVRAKEIADELSLWAKAWWAKRKGCELRSRCWDSFAADATAPLLEPSNHTSTIPPQQLRFRQVRLLSSRWKQ